MAGFDEDTDQEHEEPAFAMGSVRGWRAWWAHGLPVQFGEHSAPVLPGAVKLLGSYSSPWDDGVNIAECRRDGQSRHDPVTEEECGCGFWGYWRERFLAEASLGRVTYNGTQSFPVGGLAEGWGRTRTGTRGFRSAKARIIALAPLFKLVITGMSAQSSSYDLAPRIQASYEVVPARLLPAYRPEFPDYVPAYPYPYGNDGFEAAWMTGFRELLERSYPSARVYGSAQEMTEKEQASPAA